MTTPLNADTQPLLVDALKPLLAARHGLRADEVVHVQTHISHVLLAGDRAYKIKKPMDFGFLDFSTLARRRRFCEEELRLNRRLAGDLYQRVEAIGGSASAPELAGDGQEIESRGIEYMVVMRRFEQDHQLDRVASAGALSLEEMDRVALLLARFHAEAAVADPDSAFGTPETVYAPMGQNFEQIAEFLDDEGEKAQLARIQAWTDARHAALTPLLAQRRAGNRIRECHGDMHLANMALIDGELVIFDGIEFNDDFRWIDVINDLAFLLMDLNDRGLTAHARRLLNRYLEETGDYEAVPLLCFYQAYRAMVRAKVALFGLHHAADEDARAQIRQTYRRYADLAERFTRPMPVFVAITHGVSGSGKSIASAALVEATGAIRVRSDAERQRLFAAQRTEGDRNGLGEGIYNAKAGEQTYQRLLELAEGIAEAGYPVVADATFLSAARRAPWPALARSLSKPFFILDMHCDPETLARFVSERLEAGSDISEANLEVLKNQLANREPLSETERRHALRIRCDAPIGAQIGELLPVLLGH